MTLTSGQGGAGEQPAMPCYRMTLAYDGTDYCGWQVQPGVLTIQGVLEAALQRIVGLPVRVIGSGRTDSGVHARGQVASFRCTTRLTPDTLCRALNAHTPDDIHVREVCQAPEDFHAIRSAVAKRYRYVIQDGPIRDLFERAYSWYLPRMLDVDAMRRGSVFLLGEHDFRSFEAAGAPRKTSVRRVHELTLVRTEQDQIGRIVIEIEANGFLYNMVRNIVGSLVLVGRGERPAGWIETVLEARDRAAAGPTAPACGLTLLLVRYAEPSSDAIDRRDPGTTAK